MGLRFLLLCDAEKADTEKTVYPPPEAERIYGLYYFRCAGKRLDILSGRSSLPGSLFLSGELALVAGEEICPRREEFQLMPLPDEIGQRLEDSLPGPYPLIDTEILAELLCPEGSHRMQQHRCRPDDMEHIGQRLLHLFWRLPFTVQSS